MDIVSYNCCNFKANNLMIDHLINNNDICFFIGHWLGADDAHYFNADFFNRNKRFDKLFLSLLERKNITDAASLFNCTDINTYSKGSYGAVLVHILVSPSLIERISKFRIIEEPSDCSEHIASLLSY